jgi:hypothetical protein
MVESPQAMEEKEEEQRSTQQCMLCAKLIFITIVVFIIIVVIKIPSVFPVAEKYLRHIKHCSPFSASLGPHRHWHFPSWPT